MLECPEEYPIVITISVSSALRSFFSSSSFSKSSQQERGYLHLCIQPQGTLITPWLPIPSSTVPPYPTWKINSPIQGLSACRTMPHASTTQTPGFAAAPAAEHVTFNSTPQQLSWVVLQVAASCTWRQHFFVAAGRGRDCSNTLVAFGLAWPQAPTLPQITPQHWDTPPDKGESCTTHDRGLEPDGLWDLSQPKPFCDSLVFTP